MLANIFQIRKGNRQRRPGQAATENTAILIFFLELSAVTSSGGGAVRKLLVSSTRCRPHYAVRSLTAKSTDGTAFIEYDISGMPAMRTLKQFHSRMITMASKSSTPNSSALGSDAEITPLLTHPLPHDRFPDDTSNPDIIYQILRSN